MEITQNSISHEDGLLILTCLGTLDEKTSPAIFGSVLKYAKEAPQVAVFDLNRVEGIKTDFITGILEITKYLQKNGGTTIVIPGKLGDLLEITGIKQAVHISESVAEAKAFARERFPQVINFVRDKQQQQNISHVTEGDNVDPLSWKFFDDEEKKQLNIENILKYAVAAKASDVHLAGWKPITVRIEWVLIKMDHEPALSREHLDQVKNKILQKHPDILERLEKSHDADFGYVTDGDGISFRVNGAWALENLNFTFRRIEQNAKTIQELDLPQAIDRFINAKQGLVLVTGPTGSGKSTTLVAMLEEINKSRGENIITIEDPIEFLFSDKKSIFSQREVGRDTNSFVSAIRASMREDPNVVMIGEMRDPDTVEAALNLAETGHLVFSTLHTSGSVQTISRISQFFSPEQQRQIYTRLADSLLGVLSQRLVPRRDGSNKRIAIFELMLVNSGIKNLIRSGDLSQIDNAIQMGRSEGMIPMYVHAQELERKWIIHREDYAGFFTNQDI
jgi:twitching motility protein PilT